MRATTYFGLALGLVFNQIPFVFSQSLAPPPISSDTAGSTTTYIIELASAASNGASSKRSLTVSIMGLGSLAGLSRQPRLRVSPARSSLTRN